MSIYTRCPAIESVRLHKVSTYRRMFLPMGAFSPQKASTKRRYLATGDVCLQMSTHRRCLYLQKVSTYRWCLAKESDYSQKVLSTILTFSCSKVGSNWISPDSLMVHVTPQTRHFIGKPASTIAMQAALIAHESNFGC